MMKRLCVLFVVLATGCATPTEPTVEEPAEAPILATPGPKTQAQQRGGGYYKDDGPGENPPANLASIPDAVPKMEAPHRFANRPYTVFGIGYAPIASAQGYKERGVASWYGKKFHGQKTSSGEIYDMYGMTGAHKTLPIPSYAKVTNLANGKSVVVRINDRGPFHSERLIDLSYAAAFKLGYVSSGSARVEVEAVSAGEPPTRASTPSSPPSAAPAAGEKPAAAAPSGIYVQLGAFSSRQNAEDLRVRITRQLTWMTDAVEVLSIANLWRLHVGPYASSDAARPVAERIEAELKLKPMIVPR